MNQLLARKHKTPTFAGLNKSAVNRRGSPVQTSDKPEGIPTALWGRLVHFPIPVDEGRVYLLLLKGRVVYVGQTISLGDRIARHRCKFDFDQVFYFVASNHLRHVYEGALIRYFLPAHNTSGVLDTEADDRAALISLGLMDWPDEKEKAEMLEALQALAGWPIGGRSQYTRVYATGKKVKP